MDSNLDKLKDEYQDRKMSEEQKKMVEETIKKAKQERMRKMKYNTVKKFALAAAGFAVIVVVAPNISQNIASAMEKIPVLGKIVDVVTFREYHYEDEKSEANVEVPKVEATQDDTEDSQLKDTTKDINNEIKEITDQLVKEFKENLKQKDEEAYQSLDVKSEVLATTPNLFTLKLVCFTASGSGYEKNYYYTIDLASKERLALSDLFTKGSDYQKVISDNIKQQMREQIKEEETPYFIDSDMPDWDFKSIKEDQSFYMNEQNELVICFDEAEVAPAYLGSVEFVIPEEVIQDIRAIQ